MGAKGGEIAFPGKRITTKVILALLLSSFIPLLILFYVQIMYIVPSLDAPIYKPMILSLRVLTIFTGCLMATGAYVVWDLARAVSRSAQLMARAKHTPEFQGRADEIGTLMDSFSRMLTTIEAQAGEINSFAAKLDAAYRELEQTNDTLKEFSFKDELTGTYNRRFLSIRLEEELQRYRRYNHPVSLVLLDLDNFKHINDQFGHSAGDEVLREIAQVLLKHSRGINVISRYGGDEFVALLVETQKSGAVPYADRIRAIIEEYKFPMGIPVTVSLGVASLPEDVTTSDDLLHAADEALYSAKRLGRNRVVAYKGQPSVLEEV
jgi:diguanylate cyclase (GGDEF)-like protein